MTSARCKVQYAQRSDHLKPQALGKANAPPVIHQDEIGGNASCKRDCCPFAIIQKCTFGTRRLGSTLDTQPPRTPDRPIPQTRGRPAMGNFAIDDFGNMNLLKELGKQANMPNQIEIADRTGVRNNDPALGLSRFRSQAGPDWRAPARDLPRRTRSKLDAVSGIRRVRSCP